MPNFRAGPSSRSASMSVSAAHGGNHSMRQRNSIMASSSRRSFSRSSGAKGSRSSDKCASQTPRQLVRVFDDDNNDVTPVPLYQSEPAAVRSKVTRFFLDEISVGSASYHTSVAGSLSTPFSRSLFGSTRISSPSVIESINEEIEDPLSKRDFPIHYAEVHWISDAAAEKVTEEMLKEVIDIYFTETESVSLLDIPNKFVSVDSEGADAIIERNKKYAEICSSRMGNNKYVDRAMQTLNEPMKNKHIQSDCVVMVDTASIVTTWDLYDSLLSVDHQESVSTHNLELVDFHEAAADISKAADLSFSLSSTASSASTASSMNEVFGKTVNIECELQLVLQSEHFQNHLQIMERTILENVMQPKLAAYRQLPVLNGGPAKPGTGEDAQGPQARPSLEYLWTFTCDLTKGCSVSSMVWNKRNPDLLAVGYGEFDLSYQNPGLVCCWSLKNHTWPDRFIHCNYAVTCLDFSPNNPSQLAVGMINGNIAIYDVQTMENKTCVVSSCECHNKHMGPVWELKWIQQEVTLTGDEKVEALFSVAADGRICKWLLCNNGLDCIDLMKLNRVLPTKRKKMEQKAESVLSAVTPGLCFDFHPTDCSIYLVGTFEGLVHQGSSSNTQHFLEIYRKHSCPVNCLAWSPFNDEAFLSGSSDWTIQLWRRDQSQPVMSFISTQRAVVDIKWSPKKATVFAAIKEEVLEIWDLSANILDPVIVKQADPGVQLKALLIAAQTDCVLVGDSDGRVTVYKIKDLKIGQSNQMKILDGIIG